MKKIFFIAAILAAACASAISRPAEAADPNFAQGMELYEKGLYSKARESFSKVDKSRASEYSVAAFLSATIAASESLKLPEIVGLYENAFSHPPKNNEARLALSFGDFAAANGLWKDYLRLTESLENLEPLLDSNATLRWQRAKALYHTGKTQEAARVLSKMWDLFSESVFADACDMLAFGIMDGDEFAKIFAFTEEQKLAKKNLCGSFRRAVALSEELPEITRENVNDLSLGQLLYLSEKFGDSNALSILRIRAESDTLNAYSWKALYFCAQRLFAGKEYEEALKVCLAAQRNASATLAETAKLSILKGDSLRLLGNFDAARKAYEEVFMNRQVRGEPMAEAIYKTGVTWFEQGEYLKAHAYFERVYVAFFAFEYWGSRAYFYGAKSLEMSGRPSQAYKVILEYLKRAKDGNSRIYKESVEYLQKLQKS